MPDFDRIDLMNFAIYGNDYDSQWDEIRAYLKSSAAAQRELEEIKRTLPSTSSMGKRRRDPMSMGEAADPNDPEHAGRDSSSSNADHQTKSWWKKIIGD
ncbi:hypothetical protein EHQ58_09815 [Leptospira ognonensis]|uniref:Uncharacterized protein n=1 Tax=Leptospira ognonensis TaxID=2484945 RepID=A0A4R9K245_9LEPT|nr:hypothetical protein [Leptospira ognonensis]TGL59196.1 hypothetical protein EHQ58_09815 [Leptospira ognonensis]